MDTAEIKNEHLYLKYTYYSTTVMGYREAEDIHPIDRIVKLVENQGPRGGDHGWQIVGKEEKVLSDFGRKHTDLREKVKVLLLERKIPTELIQGSGSGPCY